MLRTTPFPFLKLSVASVPANVELRHQDFIRGCLCHVFFFQVPVGVMHIINTTRYQVPGTRVPGILPGPGTWYQVVSLLPAYRYQVTRSTGNRCYLISTTVI